MNWIDLDNKPAEKQNVLMKIHFSNIRFVGSGYYEYGKFWFLGGDEPQFGLSPIVANKYTVQWMPSPVVD